MRLAGRQTSFVAIILRDKQNKPFEQILDTKGHAVVENKVVWLLDQHVQMVRDKVVVVTEVNTEDPVGTDTSEIM